jgi:uncharacterized protein
MSALICRHFATRFDPATPRHWLPGNEFLSAFLNAYTMMVPANEAFYIRTLRRAKQRIGDPGLLATVDDFVRQEAQHGNAHKRYWRALDTQGYRFRGFERAVDWLAFRLPEKIAPLSWRVSMVASVEHINAFVAHEFLSQRILAYAHPPMRALMEWHFAEEIEHKQVAFDVLRAVAPGYGTRLAGFLIAVPLFFPVLILGAALQLWQDGRLFKRATWAQCLAHWGPGNHMLLRSARHLLAYLQPGFEPGGLDDAALADAVIARYSNLEPPVLAAAR